MRIEQGALVAKQAARGIDRLEQRRIAYRSMNRATRRHNA
jgi:hypothetical protein